MLCCSSYSLYHSFPCTQSLLTSRRLKLCHSARVMKVFKQKSGTFVVKSQLDKEEDFPISNSPITEQDSPTPLVTALEACAAQNAARFHFPGHNTGRGAPSSITRLLGSRPFAHDLSGLPEIGKGLFCPDGPVVDAQKLAAELFGASETWFLVGGTTCGVLAAIMATCSPGDYLILPRSCHISAISAMVLSGAQPKYIIPEYDVVWDIFSGVSSSQVEQAIKELEIEGKKPAAVFIISPTYHGTCSNLSQISQLCHSYGIPLIVDEAHGAHLRFHPQFPDSALQQEADLVVQSTHKVLCSLTQSSMLHMSGNIVDSQKVRTCLQAIQSTSPSYLLLASLDAARAHLSVNADTLFDPGIDLALQAKHLINEIPGVSVFNPVRSSDFPAMDPLRLTIGFWQLGLSGYKAGEMLYRDHRVVCELVGTRSAMFAVNLGTSRDHIQRLVSGVRHLAATSAMIHGGKGREQNDGYETFPDIKMGMTPRDAYYASKKKVPLEESLGEVCGEFICPYPPGVPVVAPGEVLTQKALDYLLDVKSKGAFINGASNPSLTSIVVCNM